MFPHIPASVLALPRLFAGIPIFGFPNALKSTVPRSQSILRMINTVYNIYIYIYLYNDHITNDHANLDNDLPLMARASAQLSAGNVR